MKITVDVHTFREQFRLYDRYDTFSYNGYEVLFNFLEDCFGDDYELDVIEICCDWAEEPLQDILDNYNLETLEELEEQTTVLHVQGDMYIYQAF
jgi:hypothetical protein